MTHPMGSDRRTFLRTTALAGGGALGAAALSNGPLAAATPLAGGATAGVAAAGWSADARIRELGIVLPRLDAAALQTIVPGVRVGNLLFMSGHGPRGEDGRYVTGKVGADLDADAGYAAGRAAGTTMLAAMRELLGGSLDSVVRVVKVLGMVNATPDFTQQPRVVNGFSELLIEVFGDNGRGARSAVGVGSLPGGWAIEVEGIFELRS
jgi:enamine deaminase RidA (YjgF/YER057c/UK114 family)